MRHKKSLPVALLAMCITCFVATPVYAHGHHRQAAPANTSYQVCPYDDCAETGRHTHEGTYYCGYHHESGYCDGYCGYAGQSYGCRGGHHGCYR